MEERKYRRAVQCPADAYLIGCEMGRNGYSIQDVREVFCGEKYPERFGPRKDVPIEDAMVGFRDYTE